MYAIEERDREPSYIHTYTHTPHFSRCLLISEPLVFDRDFSVSQLLLCHKEAGRSGKRGKDKKPQCMNAVSARNLRIMSAQLFNVDSEFGSSSSDFPEYVEMFARQFVGVNDCQKLVAWTPRTG